MFQVPGENTTVELNDLTACVTYNISVYAVGVDNSESKPETIIVTVASEGKLFSDCNYHFFLFIN